MKVIFLDIDGVLNSTAAFERGAWMVDDDGQIRHGMLGIDPENIPPLREILDRSGAEVVLSSTWRLSATGPERTALNLKRAGLPLDFIGVTPSGGGERGPQIQEWLDAWNDSCPEDPISHFVILDDSSDMAHLMPHLVQTSWAVGLLPEHVAPALAMLGAE